MTLPTGQISMSQVNVELSRSSTATISLNESEVRTLAGIASGTISMSNLQGKSSTVPVNWQAYSGGAGGGSTGNFFHNYQMAGGGGSAGVRVRSTGQAFTPGTWYTVVIGAGGAGATYAWQVDTFTGNPGTYSSIQAPDATYYTTLDTTAGGLTGQGGFTGGVDGYPNTTTDDQPGSGKSSQYTYGGQGGGAYTWGGIAYVTGGRPGDQATQPWYAGGGGAAGPNNGGVGDQYFGGAGAGHFSTTSIINLDSYYGIPGLPFSGGGGGGHAEISTPPGQLGAPSNGYGGGMGGRWFEFPAESAMANTGGGGGGGARNVGTGTQNGGNGGSGTVFIQYPDSYPALTFTGSMETLSIASGYRTYKLNSSGQFKIG